MVTPQKHPCRAFVLIFGIIQGGQHARYYRGAPRYTGVNAIYPGIYPGITGVMIFCQIGQKWPNNGQQLVKKCQKRSKMAKKKMPLICKKNSPYLPLFQDFGLPRIAKFGNGHPE